MNILNVTSETLPFSKSGGLADVVASLSSALSKKHTVKIIMPFYGFIKDDGFTQIDKFKIEMLGKNEEVNLYSTYVDKVEYIAVSHPLFRQRNGIYGADSFAPYPDNSYRYLLFCKAVEYMVNNSSIKYDIVHAHDWTCGFICKLIKDIKTVFTIHNLAYQGVFSAFDILRANIKPDDLMIMDNNLNMLKTGLEYANIITTVSKTYAEEIKGAKFGCGLNHILVQREKDLYGILNGIDECEWNPETDKLIDYNYSSKDLSGKAKMKALIQKRYGLEVDKDIPLITMISRIAIQKGFEELLVGQEVTLESVLKDNNAQFIILGTGDEKYIKRLRNLEEKYNNLKVLIDFDNKLSHELEACADMFLMPSRYEPCGLNQLYSLKYGTLPIVHSTGGLKDSIIDLNDKGNGFIFDNLSSFVLLSNIRRAIDTYINKREDFNTGVQRAMSSNFSWDSSAIEYEKIYHL